MLLDGRNFFIQRDSPSVTSEFSFRGGNVQAAENRCCHVFGVQKATNRQFYGSEEPLRIDTDVKVRIRMFLAMIA